MTGMSFVNTGIANETIGVAKKAIFRAVFSCSTGLRALIIATKEPGNYTSVLGLENVNFTIPERGYDKEPPHPKPQDLYW